MVESLAKVRSPAKYVLLAAVQSRRNNRESARLETLATYNCREFWPDISNLISIMQPLDNCIGVAGTFDSG